MRKNGLIVTMKTGEAVIGISLAALGLFMIAGANQMTMGSFAIPGPGFLPMALGALLVASGIFISGRAVVASDSVAQTTDFFHRSVCVALLTLVWVAFAFERFGAELTFGVFISSWLWVYAALPWFLSGLAGIATSIGVCWVFRVILGVNLPRGLLDFYY